MHSIFRGLDMFRADTLQPAEDTRLTRRTIRSFPSAYQILPHQDFYLRDDRGRQFDPHTKMDWLENDTQRARLADAQRFNPELGKSLSVETLCFFGRKHPTVSQGIALVDPTGLWEDIAWETAPSGDGTVPEASAVHKGAQQKLPFTATHGNIYIHPAVLEVLQWELRDRFLAGAGVERPLPRNMLSVTTEHEQVLPGALIRLTASLEGEVSAAALALLDTVSGPESMSPEAFEAVRDGRIHVQLAWQSGLPGNPPLLAVPDVVYGVPRATPTDGEYVGEIQAHLAEGYYRLLSEAWLDGVRATDTDLLIVDDGHPGWTIGPVTGKVVARVLE